jgi:hypothetical protein
MFKFNMKQIFDPYIFLVIYTARDPCKLHKQQHKKLIKSRQAKYKKNEKDKQNEGKKIVL